MKMKKVFLAVSMSALIASVVPQIVSADSNTIENAVSGTIDVSNAATSPALTFDQLSIKLAEDKGISVEQAKTEIKADYVEAELAKSRTARTAAPSIDQLEVQALAATYATYGVTLVINPEFNPKITWYCEISEGGGYRGIVKVLSSNLVRTYNGLSKQFSGNLYVNLESANKIHYILNGDFLNNGTTSVTGGASISVGGIMSLDYSVTSASNEYQYVYMPGDFMLYPE